MKNKLLVTQLLVSVCYGIIYLIRVFVEWRIMNPFDWIIKMPTYDQDDRFGILISTLAVYGFAFMLVHNFSEEQRNKK